MLYLQWCLWELEEQLGAIVQYATCVDMPANAAWAPAHLTVV